MRPLDGDEYGNAGDYVHDAATAVEYPRPLQEASGAGRRMSL
jgi:hypothetical protein